jgi:hypothetical protein
VNTMHSYAICGMTLASNIPLPELNSAADPGVGCKFLLQDPEYPPPDHVEWFHKLHIEQDDGRDGEEPWICFAHRQDGYLLRFPSCGDFLLSADGTEVRCVPLPDIPAVTVRHLLLDQVIPFALSRKEQLVLHASAVATERGVIAFAGKSGRGKSTLALMFAQNGSALVSDDCLVVRGEEGNWSALASYPGVRVWQSTAAELVRDDANTADVAHYTSKRRIVDMQGLRFSPSPAPILALFVLSDEQPAISIERLVAGRAFMAWAEFAYNLDIGDRMFLRRHFEAAGLLAIDVPTYSVCYPREFISLPAVREAILNRLEEANDDIK